GRLGLRAGDRGPPAEAGPLRPALWAADPAPAAGRGASLHAGAAGGHGRPAAGDGDGSGGATWAGTAAGHPGDAAHRRAAPAHRSVVRARLARPAGLPQALRGHRAGRSDGDLPRPRPGELAGGSSRGCRPAACRQRTRVSVSATGVRTPASGSKAHTLTWYSPRPR